MRGNRLTWLLLGLLACTSLAVAGDRRDIVFDCPCSAEFVAGADGAKGTLRLTGGVRSLRAVESGPLRLSANRWGEPVGASAVPLPAHDRRRGEWEISLGAPAAGAVIEIHLFEEAGRIATDGGLRWHQHEALALWPVPSDETPGPLRFVDILTDSDGDGVGDANERLAGTLPHDPESTPGETVVDVLALYTAEYAAAESGYPYTRLLHAISVASAIFEDSATGLRLRMVGMSEIALDESGWAQTDRREELIDAHGADVPMQFSPNGPCKAGACARPGFTRTSRWSDGIAWDGTATPTVTAHELGHVMGLAHSARQGEAHGAWRWSRGHYVAPWGEHTWGTIMSYGRRHLFGGFGGVFSDPSRDCVFGPCGVADNELDGADSVTSLDLLRFQIGAHRAPGVDSDGDGIVDVADAAPDDPGDWFDVDGDGTADNADPDDDNDGTPDADDPFPLDAEEWADVDGDGVGDNTDEDVRDLSPFRDPALRTAVEEALGKASGAPISMAEMATLGVFEAQWRDIRDLTGLQHATGLVELHLRGNRIEDLEPLTGLRDLERLDVSNNAVADLSPLAGLNDLWQLSLDDNPVDDVSPLAELPALRCLFLSYTGVEFADVVALPRFARFGCLGISGLGVADLSPLSGLDLVHLHLSDNAVSDLAPLENHVRLRRLYLNDNRVSDLAPLANLVELERLYLNGNAVSDLEALKDLTRLRGLTLESNQIVDVSPLSAMIDLEWLVLDDNEVTDINPLAAMAQMKWLYLGYNRISDASALAAMTGMNSLRLAGNAIADIVALEGMTNLNWLNLDDNRISDLSPLAAMAGMNSLSLSNNAVTDIGALEGLTNLSWLDLSGNGVADLGPLASLAGLEQLYLDDNLISDIEPLADLVELEQLSLDGNRVSNLVPLNAMTRINWLDLASNAIVDIGPIVKRSVFGGRASAGARVDLDYNPLDAPSTNDHIPTLESWGVLVRYTRSGSKGKGISIADPTLRALIADELAQSALHVDDPANKWPIGALDELRLYGQGIASLAGLEAASGLENLYAASNRIADLSPLANLLSLDELDLRHNRITDIAPLVANADLGRGDWVALDGNPLSEVSLNAHVPALLERGVKVSVGAVTLAVVTGEAPGGFDVSGYFEALLGEGAALTATSGDLSLATADIADGALVVTPGARAGSVSVTVEARSSSGRTARLEFLVRVRGPWLVPQMPSAPGSRQGFVRVANHDGRAGEVRILPVDDAGQAGGELTLSIGAGQTVHFNSDDLETGNPSKGLTGGAGDGRGDWRLALRSDLDLEVLAYVRTRDGFLTSMHDVAKQNAEGHQVPTFNPASNYNQRSLLRVSNLGSEDAEVTISGVDDHGASPGTEVVAQVRAGVSLLLTADDLEVGGSGLTGALGDGQGKWRLTVRSAGELSVMSLLASPGGHLTNLSTPAPAALKAGRVHAVPLFPSAFDPLGRQGFVRIVNRSDAAGEVRIVPHDDTGLAYDALTLALDAGRTAHFNSDDLELGSPAKGLTGSTGAGRGDWRLELSSELDLEVLAYVRTPSGFLTSMHDVVRSAGRRHEVATFNPGSNWRQESKLRIVNPGTRPAHVTIGGVDDGAKTPGDVVRLTVPVGAAVTVTAPQLEAGDYAFHDRQRASLGDGRGKWRLWVDSEQPIFLVNVLASPTGHLTNLSTNPNR